MNSNEQGYLIPQSFKAGDWAFSFVSGWAKCVHYYGSLEGIAHDWHFYSDQGYQTIGDEYPALLSVENAALLGFFPPKAKVKKTRQVWVNVYRDDTATHLSEASAKACITGNALAVAVPVTIEYEVEE